MKTALVEGARRGAEPGLKGVCPGCDQPVLARCGKKRVWHWAHKVECNCPLNKEETDWHRGWKNHFPVEWQEVFHSDINGERHFADVKTKNSWVLEFQHSPISSEERASRNKVYGKITWVVHLYRQQETKRFFEMANGGLALPGHPYTVIVEKKGNYLLSDWGEGIKPVLFDIEGNEVCWLMLPIENENLAYFAKVKKNDFINLHISEDQNCGYTKLLNHTFQIISGVLQKKKGNARKVKLPPLNKPSVQDTLGYRVVPRPRLSRRRRRF